MFAFLAKDKEGQSIQAFPIKDGFCNLTTGTHNDITLFHCVVDGDAIVTWPSGNTDTLACIEGDDVACPGATSVQVSSGTFHLA